eukprot:TRINITY_DN104160_c0_g1_i1.p1 TRINITY_DN104160_c0_g1~~TRINITY_DN104160_c0_g1_i1.p1  ORF type:complete len:211 (+),score=44.58 TRINITY_DN104160_c0_g1_i1:68-634(+)
MASATMQIRTGSVAMPMWAGAASEKRLDLSELPDSRESRFYHYPDATHSDQISDQSRGFLQACCYDAEEVKAMLDSGAPVHQGNINGFSGLHMAAWKLQLEVAEVLLERGHDVNATEVNGLTPLDYCVDTGFATSDGDGLNVKPNKPYHAMVELLESYGGVCREERCWLQAANQERFAPNLPSKSAIQ